MTTCDKCGKERKWYILYPVNLMAVMGKGCHLCYSCLMDYEEKRASMILRVDKQLAKWIDNG